MTKNEEHPQADVVPEPRQVRRAWRTPTLRVVGVEDTLAGCIPNFCEDCTFCFVSG